MPGQDDENEGLPGAESIDPPAGDPPADDPVAVALAQAPADVRNSPEYKALEKAARKTSRQLGQANRQLEAVRTQSESDRIAAEAERQAALEAALAAELGEDGIDAFNELAELSQTNPVEAARRFKALTSGVQSAPPVEPPAAEPTTETEAPVTSNAVPPPPGAVDGSTPLQPPAQADEIKAITDPLDARWTEVVERNLTPAKRNRVTMKERAGALIGYVASAYLKSPEIQARLKSQR